MQPGGSAAGAGLRRTPQPRRHRCEAAASAGRQRWRGAARGDTKWRGAARGDNRAIVASPGSARTPSPTSPCNAPTLPVATVLVGAALETPATSNLRAPTRPMARVP
ncbi:hypothetical protein Ctob_016333, partial [Chrysochromulina tobinii]